jgi:Glycosyl transferase family 90
MWFKSKKTKEEPRELLKIALKDGQVSSIENFNSFQTRAESSIKMTMDAIKCGISAKTLSFNLHTGDFPLGEIRANNFYYCCDCKEKLNSVFPDFIFDHWQQAGIEDYTTTTEKISAASEVPFVYDKMLWIGNVKTNPIREKIISLSEQFPEKIEAHNTYVDQYMEGNKKNTYISLADHTKYKYLIDLEGRGYSGRLKLLLYTKRLLFIQERQWKSYYHFELEPYKHFIPVKNDLSDLTSQIDFVEQKGQEYYLDVVNNAYQYAKENLSYQKAVKRIQALLNN